MLRSMTIITGSGGSSSSNKNSILQNSVS